MLSFLKPKTVLKDLIPDNYVDIHSHLLPGIDDGAKNIEESQFLISELRKIGVSKFITTPHIFSGVWDNTKENILSNYNATKLLFSENKTEIKLNVAAEYLLNDHLVTLLNRNEILTLKDNYVLVEMSYINPPIQLYDIIFKIQIAGYIPILAHPERYAFYHKSTDEYKKLKKSGCLFQLNLLSTVGYYGSEVMKTANLLLTSGMIDYVGSDVHHKQHINAFYSKLLIKDSLTLVEAINNNHSFNF
ncbi:tyrosine-protein phosphatase [Flavobacterium sp.]|uniref:tyrosine-protein phosphatase n=1 Tax=Flavobacterium sp. TaxID=239 RepID=UPI0037C0CDF1